MAENKTGVIPAPMEFMICPQGRNVCRPLEEHCPTELSVITEMSIDVYVATEQLEMRLARLRN